MEVLLERETLEVAANYSMTALTSLKVRYGCLSALPRKVKMVAELTRGYTQRKYENVEKMLKM